MGKFSVAYSIITPQSAEHGDFAECGFVCENVSLREAYQEMGRCVLEDSGSWFTNSEYGHGTRQYYQEGIEEERSLHPPRNITAASYDRLKKLFGV